jgi:hypothetical protein
MVAALEEADPQNAYERRSARLVLGEVGLETCG